MKGKKVRPRSSREWQRKKGCKGVMLQMMCPELLPALGAALHFSYLSARIGDFNAIEKYKAKIKERESKRKLVLELIQGAVQYGTKSKSSWAHSCLLKSWRC
jgi:hypothetical protein